MDREEQRRIFSEKLSTVKPGKEARAFSKEMHAAGFCKLPIYERYPVIFNAVIPIVMATITTVLFQLLCLRLGIQ